jgi:hypothetical protein
MALSYSVHPSLYSSNHRSPSLPSIHYSAGEGALALGAASVGITGPCEICLVPEEKVRLDVRAAINMLDPASSPLVLPANLPTWFHLDGGTWYLKASAT